MSIEDALARQRVEWTAYLNRTLGSDIAAAEAVVANAAVRSAQITEALKQVEARRSGNAPASLNKPRGPAVKVYRRAEFDTLDQPGQRAIAKAVRDGTAALID